MGHDFFAWCAQQELQQYLTEGDLLALVTLYLRVCLDTDDRKILPHEVDPNLTKEWIWTTILGHTRWLAEQVEGGEFRAIDDIGMIARHCEVSYEQLELELTWVEQAFAKFGQQLYHSLAEQQSSEAARELIVLRANDNIPDFSTAGPNCETLVISIIRAYIEDLKGQMRQRDKEAAQSLGHLLHILNWANERKLLSALTERALGITEEEASTIALQLQTIELKGPGPLN